ncbi:HalOD1 output domain-containing protein [Natronorubrum halophilum]|uniref:HalOD1 output domain-containing protein n=1 Tax=Natronorubrum halophilum TaxID=1702106 RepID=UPI0010C22BED|nr:HalOD1 output domain-containing protein [Natronorubrum halophilum]
MAQDQPITLDVAQRIAELEGVPLEELQPPLHTAIDTDALNSFFESSGSDRLQPAIEFTHMGYTIQIDPSGDVTVTDTDPVTASGNSSYGTERTPIANR